MFCSPGKYGFVKKKMSCECHFMLNITADLVFVGNEIVGLSCKSVHSGVTELKRK